MIFPYRKTVVSVMKNTAMQTIIDWMRKVEITTSTV